MKIAVLGARGFLGSFLCRWLNKKHIVIEVTRNTLDLTDYISVSQWLMTVQPDAVINCAISGGGQGIEDISYSDVQRDLQIFLNFYNNTGGFKYINISSGAEFDRRTDIDKKPESAILLSHPLESYGFTKNTIARMVLNRDNFYNLRLFGCFDRTDPPFRLFKKFKLQQAIAVTDRYFDYISASDFARVVDYYLQDIVLPKDINCVYEDKLLLSEQLKLFARYHITNAEINVIGTDNKNYTGNGQVLADLDILLEGLIKGIKKYE